MPTLQDATHVLGCVLTPRELEITALVSAGLRNKEIARRLGLTEGTIKAHLHNIYQKARVPNRTVLTARIHGHWSGKRTRFRDAA